MQSHRYVVEKPRYGPPDKARGPLYRGGEWDPCNPKL